MLEVVRRRVDDPIQGIPESVVTRQGDDRVLVQIPGGQLDREQARNLLQKTGFLEFKIVLDEAPTEELLRKRARGRTAARDGDRLREGEGHRSRAGRLPGAEDART